MPNKPTKPNSTALQQQIAELTDALQRERADVINVRRRHEEQLAGLKNVVKANVVRDLLPVIDNFERALKHVPELRLAELDSASPLDSKHDLGERGPRNKFGTTGVRQFKTT